MTKQRRFSAIKVAAVGVALSLSVAFTGCSSGSSGSAGEAAPDKTLTLGTVSGWNDYTGTVHVYKAILEKHGYTVEVKEFSEIAAPFAGAANGDIDVFPASIEVFHKAYWDQYQEKLEDLGPFYDNTALFLAVPDYMTEVQTIEDLPARAAEFDGKIVGIEPGAGLTKVTQDKAFPDYRLGESYELQLSSTAAMVATVKKATEAKEPIVVTSWSPFWANAAFGLRALKDPKGSYGEPQASRTLARQGFTEEYPEVAKMISNFTITDEQFGSQENFLVNKYGPGKEQEAMKAWLEENPDIAAKLEEPLS